MAHPKGWGSLPPHQLAPPRLPCSLTLAPSCLGVPGAFPCWLASLPPPWPSLSVPAHPSPSLLALAARAAASSPPPCTLAPQQPSPSLPAWPQSAPGPFPAQLAQPLTAHCSSTLGLWPTTPCPLAHWPCMPRPGGGVGGPASPPLQQQQWAGGGPTLAAGCPQCQGPPCWCWWGGGAAATRAAPAWGACPVWSMVCAPPLALGPLLWPTPCPPCQAQRCAPPWWLGRGGGQGSGRQGGLLPGMAGQ